MSANNPLLFLFETIFDLYIFILLLRFILQQVGADFYNPVSQFVVKLTSPVVLPVRKIIPGYKGMDLGILVIVFVLITSKLVVLDLLFGTGLTVQSNLYSAQWYVIRGFFLLINLMLNVFIFSIFIQAILSWVNPDPSNPVVSILHNITYPILRHARKLMPPVSGVDLSVLVALVGLYFIQKIFAYIYPFVQNALSG